MAACSRTGGIRKVVDRARVAAPPCPGSRYARRRGELADRRLRAGRVTSRQLRSWSPRRLGADVSLSDWFGSSWTTVAYVAGSTFAIYCSALMVIRVAGRRTVAQLSAFDVVVTIALGSLIATTAVSRDPSYAQGITALSTLLVLQVIAAALRQTFAFVRRLLDFAPCVVSAMVSFGSRQPRSGHR